MQSRVWNGLIDQCHDAGIRPNEQSAVLCARRDIQGLLEISLERERYKADRPTQYYYLLFSDENLISLDEWVFNTEAHPFSLTSKNGPAGGFWRGTATADDLKNTGRGTAVQIREKYRRLLSLRNIELTRKKKADAIEGQATKAPNKLVQTTSTVSGTTSDASRTISEDDHTASDEDQTSTDDGQTSTDDEPTTV